MELSALGRKKVKEFHETICSVCLHHYSVKSSSCKACIVPISNGNGFIAANLEVKSLNDRVVGKSVTKKNAVPKRTRKTRKKQ